MTDAAPLARALLDKAVAAFRALPPEARIATYGALDAFVEAPGPATFLAASRALAEARRDRLLETTAGATVRHDFADGLEALRTVDGIAPEIVERLGADLPLDARAGRRLMALAALARSYQELLARVVADTEQRRQRLREAGVRPRRRE